MTTIEYGPDNPRPWNPNHHLLKSSAAPHETAAVLRAQRAGYRGQELFNLFRYKGSGLSDALTRAMELEERAHRAGRRIHDSLIKRT